MIHADDACYMPVRSQVPGPWKLRVVAFLGSFFILLSAVIFLAHRSFQQAQADHQGAFRLALTVFLVTVLRYVLFNHHVGSIEELRILGEDLSVGVSLAAYVWLLYVTIAPMARARFPLQMTSWEHLLAGRLSHPLVGRDLLVGCLAGTLLTLTQCLRNLTPAW